ncbi:MAG: thiazole synthase [Candidatus Cloacimonadota bacterium]|nr:MAG: thiazole synthase [Candidatus Cloacimonadota bacterium]PIE77790.1 MAG: thiazole synthase [Candidatus Delongbacteria bacterium]
MLEIAGKKFNSRLFVGTGKFSSNELMKKALLSSGTEMVTMALRRVDLNNSGEDNFLNAIDREKYQFLPNTSGARDAEEAIRLAKLSRAATGEKWLKLEITPDPYSLMPDSVETLKAAEYLVKEGFIVLPYINADPVLAKRLENIGTAAVMPLGSMIGSNLGVKTRDIVKIIIEQSNIPVVVDAGIGVPSHASEAMELGADAVLVNTAIAVSSNPVMMAEAFKFATIAGRMGFEAGKAIVRSSASASSPLTGFLRKGE